MYTVPASTQQIETTVNFSGVGGPIEYFSWGSRYKIRQNGYATQIKMYIGSITGLSLLKIRFWKKDGTTYDLVATSEDLSSRAVANQINTFILDTPIFLREGTYHSVLVTNTSGSVIGSGSSKTSTNVYQYTGTAASFNFAWEDQTVSTGRGINLRVMMQAPQFVFIGDSIMAGKTLHVAYQEISNNLIDDPDSTIEAMFSDLNGYSYQNSGIGGDTASKVLTRLTKDLLDLKPKAAVFLVGTNDITAAVSEATYISQMTEIFDSVDAQGIQIIAYPILPRDAFTNTQNATADSFNTALKTLVESYQDGIFVDVRCDIGQEKLDGSPTPTTGNCWDLIDDYKIDNTHLNLKGNTILARELDEAITLYKTITTPIRNPGVNSPRWRKRLINA